MSKVRTGSHLDSKGAHSAAHQHLVCQRVQIRAQDRACAPVLGCISICPITGTCRSRALVELPLKLKLRVVE